MKRPDEKVLLSDILDYARRAVEAIKGRSRQELDRDFVLAAALERFVEVIGEAASKMSDATRVSISGVPWRQMIGMRNLLVHAYASVDPDVIWQVVRDDLPKLVVVLETLLADKPV